MENSNGNSKYVLETHDLSIFYGPFEAVKDVNLKIEKQKITAIIGPSGCGKTTVGKAALRLIDALGDWRAEVVSRLAQAGIEPSVGSVGDSYDNGFKIQWEAFIRHVAENAPYQWTLPEGAKGVQLVEAALQSWRERRWVDVPALAL